MKRYTREQLVFFLRKCSDGLKRTPTCKDIDNSNEFPSSKTYVKRFGSWNAALDKAGLPINVRVRYEKTELADSLKQLSKELGRVPFSTDLKSKDWCASYTTYRKYFGSWKKSLEAAGISVKQVYNLRDFIKKGKGLKT